MSEKEPSEDTHWGIYTSDQFQRNLKKYKKKHPIETQHMLINAGKFIETLNRNIPISNIRSIFIHTEPKGIKALDQRGPTKGRLKQTRMYIYLHFETRTVHFICLGDKESQPRDIQYSTKYVNNLTKSQP